MTAKVCTLCILCGVHGRICKLSCALCTVCCALCHVYHLDLQQCDVNATHVAVCLRADREMKSDQSTFYKL